MRFYEFPIAAAEPASADPRAAPGSVDDKRLFEVPKTIPNTDQSPPYLAFVLEGTAVQTIDVTLWAMYEPASMDDAFADPPAPAARLFYKIGATTTLTVGTAKTLPAPTGKIYVQTSIGPAAASILRFAPMAAPIP